MSSGSDGKGARRIPTVAEVLDTYRPRRRNEWRTEWAVALLYRPCSIVLTPLVVACRIPPGAVTFAGLVCALALPALAAGGGRDAALAVALLAIVFCILDCLDGNVARVTGRMSARGAYADFVTDLVYRASFYGAIGLLVDAGRPPAGEGVAAGAGLAAGLGCALLAILARACRLHVEVHAAAAPRELPPEPERLSGPARLMAFLHGIDHLLPVTLLVLAPFGGEAWALAWIAVQSAGDFVLTQRAAWLRLR